MAFLNVWVIYDKLFYLTQCDYKHDCDHNAIDQVNCVLGSTVIILHASLQPLPVDNDRDGVLSNNYSNATPVNTSSNAWVFKLLEVLLETFVKDLTGVNCSCEIMVGKNPESNQKANIKYQANGVFSNLVRFVVRRFVDEVANNAESKQTPNWDDEGLGVVLYFEASI